jgi:Carboxypeptidase regulatory-like domain/TonB dependent receptor/TonB-dependent Receptor Plug Domain
MCKLFFLLLTALTFTVSAIAQIGTSSVTGLVTDSSGAVVSNAKVEVKNEATGVVYQGTTSDTGKYTLPSLNPGSYSISITAGGFQKYTSFHNVLNVGQPLVVNATMKVGAANESVEVESSYQRIETTNATISDVITEKQVKNLPLNGRNPLTLLTLEPGVTQRPSGSSGSGTHVFGSRDRSHNVTIDGIDANESSVPNPQSNIQRLNPDNVQEFRTVTLNATAETGRNSGANVMVATKAGSNGIHGDVYEFLRNNALNSNEWYNTANKQPVPKLNLNQFGFDVGGPLIKNKTFWFGSFQHNIIKESAPIASFFGIPTTYTPSLRAGTFRYVKGTVVANGVSLSKNDPRLVDASGNLASGVVPCSASVTNNCIASYSINSANDPLGKGADTAMQALANSLPNPNAYASAGDGLNFGGFLWNPPTKFAGPNYLIRIDHTFGPNDNIFGHWLQNHYDTTQGDFLNARPEVYPGFPPLGEALRIGRNLAVSYRHTFTPNLVNEFTVGFNRFAFAFTFGESNPGFGDPTKNPAYADDCVYGSTVLMTAPGCVSPHTQRAVTTPQFIDNISWTHGAHTFHAGINFRMYYHNDSRGFFGSTITAPGILFSQSSHNVGATAPASQKFLNVPSTGINSTDLSNLNQAIVELAGIPSSLRKSFVADFTGDKYVATPYATVYSRAHQYDSYIQDEWRIRPNITINAGLRWEYNPAPFDAKSTLVPDKPIDGSQGPVTFVKSDRWFNNNNIGSVAPRFGIAWSPDQKTSIRAGYSWLFDTISTFQVTAMAGKVPGFMLGCTYSISTSLSTSNSAGCTPAASLTGLTNRVSGGFPNDVPAPVAAPSASLAQPIQSRGTAPSVGAFDPNLKNPSVHEWNISIQRELPLHIVAEIGYVGKRGTHLYRAYDANQIDPLKHAGFLDSFNIAHANVVKGCLPDGTSTASCTTGAVPTMLLSLVTSAFLNSSTSITDFRQNSIGNVAARMDNLSATDTQRTANLPLTYFRPNPQFNQIFFQDSGGDSYYHGFIATARRRFEQGLTFNLSYTWSKSIDDLSIDPTGASTGGGLSSTGGSVTPTDIRNFRIDRSVSDFDNKHVLVGSMYYELPFGRGKKFGDSAPGWLNHIVGGWSLTQIFNYQSGEPFTIYAGSFTTNSQHVSTAVLVGDKPGSNVTYNVPGIVGPVLYQTGGFVTTVSSADLNCQVFANNKTKLCIPAAGQQGERRNSFRGPDFWNIDGGLLKNFSITERFKLQFRAEIFNMLNHPNFENPRNASVGSPTITSSNFGTVCCTTAAVQSSSQVNPIGEPSRVIQLGLKLSF